MTATTSINRTCPHCKQSGSHESKGLRRCKVVETVRRYQCAHCSKSFSERTGTLMHGLRSSRNAVISALHARSEGVGLRGAGRLVGKTHPTIALWEERAKALGEKLDREVDVNYNAILESDEIYTKVGRNRPASESSGWTACGIDRQSRYVTRHVTGTREDELFERHTKEAFLFVGRSNCHMVSDGEGRYASHVWKHRGAREVVEGEKTGRPGPPKGSMRCLRKGLVVQRKVKGSQNRAQRRRRYEVPLKTHPESKLLEQKDVHANHSEAYNASLRRRCSAFRRRTNTYAKVNKGLERALGAQRVIHNWIRPHHFHGKTPAEVLGWSDEAMTFETFVIMAA